MLRLSRFSLHLPRAVAFMPGLPAFDEFPVKVWTRLLTVQAHRMQPDMAGYNFHLGGYGPLREALTSYLRSSRKVVCDPDQVFIVSSTRAGLDIICRLLCDPGSAVLMEDPGYNPAKNVMRAAGLNIVPVPLDADGLRIDLAERSDPTARLVYVTPSHQWPTGVSLSVRRRQQLLDWAERRSAWVVEDDYDSEFRFDGRPLPTLQGIDGGRHVIYLGTFSKVMFPSLRTAYVVVPRSLAPAFREAVPYAGQEPPMHIQAALAEFIHQGHFFSHIRRMRRLYKRRQALFTDAMIRHLGDGIPVDRPAGGMQLSLVLPGVCPATAVSLSAGAAGLYAKPFSISALTNAVPNALHLGFAAVPERLIDPSAKTLASIILATR
jgi:GntR family transcriptional regulator/MocR family aminotransferase